MSTTHSTTTLPNRVQCEILGREVQADVVGDHFDASATDAKHFLRVDVDGRRYRVPADDADPVR